MEEISNLTDDQIAFLLADPDARKVDGATIKGNLPRETKESIWRTYHNAGWPRKKIQAMWDKDYSHYTGPPFDPDTL